MAKYKISIKSTAAKELENIPKKDRSTGFQPVKTWPGWPCHIIQELMEHRNSQDRSNTAFGREITE